MKQKRKNGRRMLLPKYHRFKPHGDTDLVYLVDSPDYCEYDVQRGSLGTKGRVCDPVGSSSFCALPHILCLSSLALFFGNNVFVVPGLLGISGGHFLRSLVIR